MCGRYDWYVHRARMPRAWTEETYEATFRQARIMATLARETERREHPERAHHATGDHGKHRAPMRRAASTSTTDGKTAIGGGAAVAAAAPPPPWAARVAAFRRAMRGAGIAHHAPDGGDDCPASFGDGSNGERKLHPRAYRFSWPVFATRLSLAATNPRQGVGR